MQIKIRILRRENADALPFWQEILYETADDSETAAFALERINRSDFTDTEGKTVSPVRWECSCLQKKCGACAMLVNNIPRLACDCKLTDCAKHGTITLAPLKKFPPVADLIVDRSVMMQNLIQLGAWLHEHAVSDEQTAEMNYEASRCLQCGCCLEVCPNFCTDGTFYGVAAAVSAARIFSAAPENTAKDLHRTYRRHFYEGCGKSLSCRNICPAGIDTERLLVNSAAAAVWKRKNAFRIPKKEHS